MKDKIYRFKVSLAQDIYRIIDVKGKNSLYKLAEEIVLAFDFDLDHCFGFFSATKGDIYRSNERYELFNDLKDCEKTPGGKSVKKEYIYNVFSPKKKMTFLFDYGDHWEFLVECLGTSEPVAKMRYPQLVEEKGEAPEQYPDFEDEDWDDDEFEEDFDIVANHN